jgi:hypothetical protein
MKDKINGITNKIKIQFFLLVLINLIINKTEKYIKYTYIEEKPNAMLRHTIHDSGSNTKW